MQISSTNSAESLIQLYGSVNIASTQHTSACASCSADGSVRLWRSRCWTCVRIFACARADPAAPPCPFLSTAMTEKCAAPVGLDGMRQCHASWCFM